MHIRICGERKPEHIGWHLSCTVDSGNLALLTLLDLSTAFDAVDKVTLYTSSWGILSAALMCRRACFYRFLRSLAIHSQRVYEVDVYTACRAVWCPIRVGPMSKYCYVVYCWPAPANRDRPIYMGYSHISMVTTPSSMASVVRTTQHSYTVASLRVHVSVTYTTGCNSTRRKPRLCACVRRLVDMQHAVPDDLLLVSLDTACWSTRQKSASDPMQWSRYSPWMRSVDADECHTNCIHLLPSSIRAKFVASVDRSDRSYSRSLCHWFCHVWNTVWNTALQRYQPCSSVGKTAVDSKCCGTVRLWVTQVWPRDSTSKWLTVASCSTTYVSISVRCQ